MAITLLLQNIFQKFKKAIFIACQDLTNDSGFSILKPKTIFGLTSLILPEGRGQFGKDPEKSYQDDGRIKRNGI